MVWRCTTAQFAESFNTFLRMSFHVVGPRSDVCTIFLVHVTFSVAPAETFDSKMLCIRQPNLRWVHSRDEYTASLRDKKQRGLSQINVVHQLLPRGIRICFFPANLMSSTYTAKNKPC